MKVAFVIISDVCLVRACFCFSGLDGQSVNAPLEGAVACQAVVVARLGRSWLEGARRLTFHVGADSGSR